MADASVEYTLQQLGERLTAYEAALEQFKATVAQNQEQGQALRRDVEALASQQGVTLAPQPPPSGPEAQAAADKTPAPEASSRSGTGRGRGSGSQG